MQSNSGGKKAEHADWRKQSKTRSDSEIPINPTQIKTNSEQRNEKLAFNNLKIQQGLFEFLNPLGRGIQESLQSELEKNNTKEKNRLH